MTFTSMLSSKSNSQLLNPLINENAAFKKQTDKLLDLYLNEIIDKENYLTKKKKIDQKITANENRIKEINDSSSAIPAFDIYQLNKILKEYSASDKKNKAKLLSALIKKIVIYKDKIIIEWNFI